MDEQQRKLISMLNDLCGASDFKKIAASSDGSHQMTLTQSSLEERTLLKSLDSIHTGYQLTVQTRVQLTRRQIGLLLDVLNYQACYLGINFGMYLAMEHLSSLLIGQKQSAYEIKDVHERRVSLVATVLLQSVGGTELYINQRLEIPHQIFNKLIEEKLVMEHRTFGSRFKLWRPEDYIQICSVPLGTKFERVKGTSERYSSYCKGYGESHPSAHYKKTKPSSELDGETEDRENLSLTDIANLLIFTQLEMRAKFIRIGRKS